MVEALESDFELVLQLYPRHSHLHVIGIAWFDDSMHKGKNFHWFYLGAHTDRDYKLIEEIFEPYDCLPFLGGFMISLAIPILLYSVEGNNVFMM
eukprot:5760811-Amphidinium_carterae.1